MLWFTNRNLAVVSTCLHYDTKTGKTYCQVKSNASLDGGFLEYTTNAYPHQIRAHHVTHGLSVPPKVEASGVPMPPSLILHLNNTFPLQRESQSSQKGKEQVGVQDTEYDSTEIGQGSSVCKDSSNAVRDIATVHLSSQNHTEESLIFSNDQRSIETYDPATCSLPQAIECSSLVSESPYAVQVLENVENVTTPNVLPSQLNSEPVCVVYLIN